MRAAHILDTRRLAPPFLAHELPRGLREDAWANNEYGGQQLHKKPSHTVAHGRRVRNSQPAALRAFCDAALATRLATVNELKKSVKRPNETYSVP